MSGCETCLYLQKIETPFGIMRMCGYLERDGATIYSRPINCPYDNKNEEDKEINNDNRKKH